MPPRFPGRAGPLVCLALCWSLWPAAAAGDHSGHCVDVDTTVADLCGTPAEGGTYPCCDFEGSDWWADIQRAGLTGTAYPDPCQPQYWSAPNYYPPGDVYSCERDREVFNEEAYQQALMVRDNVDPNHPIFWDPPLLVTTDPCFHEDWTDCDTPGVAPLGRGVVGAGDVAEAKADVSYDGINPYAEDLLATSLAYLRDSLDIVAFSCCLYLGPDDGDCDCLVETLQGELEVRYDADTEFGYADSGRNAKHKFDVGPLFAADANAWNAAAPGSAAWLGLVLVTADMMVEEILHDCMGRKGRHREQQCDLVNLISECGATNVNCLMTERYTGTPACTANTCDGGGS